MRTLVENPKQTDLFSPSAVSQVAKELKRIIIKNRLYTQIKGKNYVNVEGWQIAGMFFGYTPVVTTVENLSDDKIIRYRAEVKLVNSAGEACGYGVAICANNETGKRGFEEYAIMSMAQTRAMGKAFRMRLGWLMNMAGYESTPSEEMTATAVSGASGGTKPAQTSARSAIIKEQAAKALKALLQAKAREEFRAIYLNLPMDVKEKIQDEATQIYQNKFKQED